MSHFFIQTLCLSLQVQLAHAYILIYTQLRAAFYFFSFIKNERHNYEDKKKKYVEAEDRRTLINIAFLV